MARGGNNDPSVLLEDRFTIASCDNSKFERVTRIRGKSAAFDAEISLDVNTQIYPLKESETLLIVFAEHLSKGGSATGADGGGMAASSEMNSLMDEFEYVMLGTVFDEDERSPDKRAVYISFGGLLCGVTADKEILSEFTLDRRLFVLLKKVGRAD